MHPLLIALLIMLMANFASAAPHHGDRHHSAKKTAAKHLSEMEQVKHESDRADAEAAKIPLAQRRRIYYDLTAADHNAVLAMDRRHTPAEQDALMLAVMEREHARVRRRWHISDDVMTAIGTEGYT